MEGLDQYAQKGDWPKCIQIAEQQQVELAFSKFRQNLHIFMI